jgi:hypothetical protein
MTAKVCVSASIGGTNLILPSAIDGLSKRLSRKLVRRYVERLNDAVVILDFDPVIIIHEMSGLLMYSNSTCASFLSFELSFLDLCVAEKEEKGVKESFCPLC